MENKKNSNDNLSETPKQKESEKKEKDEAEKDILKKSLPDVEAKALEGKTTIDANVTTECQILTYKALSEVAVQIAKELEINGAENLVICDQNDFEILYMYTTYLEQINFIKNEYEKVFAIREEHYDIIEKPQVGLDIMTLTSRFSPFLKSIAVGAQVPFVATTVLKSAIDFIALFRTDTELTGNKFDITNEALIAEIARALKKPKQNNNESNEIKLIYPKFINIGKNKLLNSIIELGEKKEKADKLIAANSTDKPVNEKISHLNELNTQYDSIIKILWTIDEKTGLTNIEKIGRGGIIEHDLSVHNVDILYLKILVAGGNNRIKRSLFRTSLTHSGSIVIIYFWLDKKGTIKGSKMFYNTTGYRKFKDLVNDVISNNFGN